MKSELLGFVAQCGVNQKLSSRYLLAQIHLRLTIQMDTLPNPDLSQLKDLREARSSAALGWMRQLSLGKALLFLIP